MRRTAATGWIKWMVGAEGCMGQGYICFSTFATASQIDKEGFGPFKKGTLCVTHHCYRAVEFDVRQEIGWTLSLHALILTIDEGTQASQPHLNIQTSSAVVAINHRPVRNVFDVEDEIERAQQLLQLHQEYEPINILGFRISWSVSVEQRWWFTSRMSRQSHRQPSWSMCLKTQRTTAGS